MGRPTWRWAVVAAGTALLLLLPGALAALPAGTTTLSAQELLRRVRASGDVGRSGFGESRYRVEAAAEAAKNSAIAGAEAQRQSTIANADAQRQATIAAAQAHAEQQRLTGEAGLSRRTATATAVRLEGEAEAAATQARGSAEAHALDDKARRSRSSRRRRCAPFGSIERLTVISSDGASDLTRTVAQNVTQGMQMASDLTGVDVAELLRRLGGVPAPASSSGHGAVAAGDAPG